MKRLRIAIIGLAAFALAGMARAQATRTWDGGGGDNLASTAANWSDDTRPTSADDILLDGTSTKNMTWDAGVSSLPDTVASWTQTEGYTGTVTFRTVYGSTGFTVLTVNGNAAVRGGKWTHVQNGGSETYRLRVTVTGNLLVTNATVLADALGYSTGNGPGSPTMVTYGGAYGGGSRGDGRDYSAGVSANVGTYGSITAPVNLGSRAHPEATSGNYYGGGAIWLAVQGTTTIAATGIISANGGSGQPGGSGGSVYLTTGALTGSGTIRANGGNASGFGSGGGGRVAIALTSIEADFSSWSGTTSAFGGNTGNTTAAAGTVYLTAPGANTLVIDNRNTGVFGGQLATLMPTGVNLNTFSNIVVRNKGVLGIRSDTTFNFNLANVTTYGVANSYISIHGDSNVTYPTDWTIADYTLSANSITAGKLVNVTVATNGSVMPFRVYHNPITASLSGNLTVNGTIMAPVTISVSGNLTVNGSISVDALGSGNRAGPGAVSTVTYGAAHGGWAGSGNRALTGSIWYNSNSYGSILAPTQAGSGGATDSSPWGAGGGAIQLTVAGTTSVAVAGALTANGGNGAHGGGSGGSIRLTTGRLEGAGTIRANGGTAGMGAGAGGRIALILTGAGQDFSSWSGANTAYGGSSVYAAAAGTVYRQTASQAAGFGTVLVDNASRAINLTRTPLPASGTATENISNTVWVAVNTTRLGLVKNAAIASLELGTNCRLELSGRTLTVGALTVSGIRYKNGAYTPVEISRLTDETGGGQVVVYSPPQGTLILMR